MSKKVPDYIPAETHFILSLEEVLTTYGVSQSMVIEIINEGIIDVENETPEQWRFDTLACQRIRMVAQLEKDLGVNTAGSGLILELLEEIKHLKTLLAIHV